MKRIFKILGIVILVIISLIILGSIFINARGIPKYDVVLTDFESSSSPEALERGEILVGTLCSGCHLNKETGTLAGSKMMDAPSEFGEIYSPNITQDKEYGIGTWTDAEILNLLRTGIKKDGQFAPPYMAKLPLMADEDINAVIAFLKSDHKLVRADATPDQDCKPSFLTKLLCNIAWKPFPMPTAPIALPDSSDVLDLGEYLTYNLECFSCHSADFKTNDYLEPPKSPGYMGGGNAMMDLKGNVIVTANISPDNATGIGSWNKEQFIKATKFGIKEGEPGLRYPMQPYARLTDHEVGAIYEYLKTVPPISNEVERVFYE